MTLIIGTDMFGGGPTRASAAASAAMTFQNSNDLVRAAVGCMRLFGGNAELGVLWD